jgi:hypothetical protein
MSMTFESVQQFLQANPTFVEDTHNVKIILDSMNQLENRDFWLGVPDALDQFVAATRHAFHWLATGAPKPKDRRPVAEILRDAGVEVSRYYSAIERKKDEAERAKQRNAERTEWAMFLRRKERDRAIEAANNIWIDLPYAPGPGGTRKDVKRSEEAKQKELARIAIEFADVKD